jgi:hypothetical protein
MKRFLSIFLIIIAGFLFFSLNNVKAQTPTPAFKVTIPGQNCGIAEDPLKNQCCNFYRPDFQVPALPGGFSILVPFIQPGLDILKKQMVQPFINYFADINSPCFSGVASTTNLGDPNCKCVNPISPSPGYLQALNYFCQKQEKPADRLACLNCANDGGIFSGIGCVKTDIKKFIEETVFSLGIGLAGGFSLLCIIYAAFMMQSSQGNPEKLKKAQEIITSCIMGLMLIIFSIFILRLIGVNILKIPGFG